MTAIDLLSAIIAQGTKIPAAAVRTHPDFKGLIDNGLLRKSGIVSSIACNICDTPHSAEVIFQDGEYGFHCHDLGWMPVSRKDLVGIEPDICELIDRLASAFDCRQRKKAPLSGQTWRIGLVETTTEPVMLYFHRNLRTEDDAHDLQSALVQEVRYRWRLAVTAQGTLLLPEMPTIQLVDFIELENGHLSEIVDPGILAGVPQMRKGGRPSEHGDLLNPIIENRIRSGAAVQGVNAEAREVYAYIKAKHPDKPIPSIATIKRHVTKARAGS